MAIWVRALRHFRGPIPGTRTLEGPQEVRDESGQGDRKRSDGGHREEIPAAEALQRKSPAASGAARRPCRGLAGRPNSRPREGANLGSDWLLELISLVHAPAQTPLAVSGGSALSSPEVPSSIRVELILNHHTSCHVHSSGLEGGWCRSLGTGWG